jgi:glycine cleavage system regulatory protein
MDEMVLILRLLISDKKGIYKRISAAVQEAGGHIKHSRLKKQMRGLSEAEIDISYGSDLFLPSILAALGRIPGVALLGSPTSARGVVSAGSTGAPTKAALMGNPTPDPAP